MKQLLALLLLICSAAWAFAQALPEVPADSLPPGGFTLSVEAPNDIKQLLERHLELQRYTSLDDLSDDELDRLRDMAKDDVQKLVATLGYFSPVIQIEQPKRPTPSATRHIVIRVTAGEPVQISQVSVLFSGPIATDPAASAQRQRIQDTWSLPAGNRFTQTAWDAAKQQALRLLTVQRYPTGRIASSLADIDPLTHQAHLAIMLDSGSLYRLGSLAISGLDRYDAQLVHRLARVPVGADYSQSELVDAQQRLADSGFFDSVFVSLDTQTDPQAAQVLVSLREAKLQKIILGLGASTDSGARLSVEHLHHKLPGLGWRALSKIAVDRDTQSISTELTSPPNVDGWRWLTSALLQNQRSGSFDVSSQRLRAGASQLGQRIDRSYFLQYDRGDTASTDLTAPELAQSISANYAFTLRNFNALPFPSGGWGWGVELGAGTTLGSTHVPYSRVVTRWQSYWILGKDDQDRSLARAGRIALRAQAGAVLAKDGVSLPVTQLFLAGGDNSVRGYGLRSIGITLADGQVSAGRYLGVGSLEWQRPIQRAGRLTDWEHTVFMDAGAVADTPADLRAKVGVGTGVRWKSPVGPLQIDLAYGVDTKALRLHLNMGFVF